MQPSLRESQEAFAAGIFGDTAAVLPHLREKNGRAAQRLRIHGNNAKAKLTAQFAEVYPVVQRLVGDDFFSQAVEAFSHQHGPHCPPGGPLYGGFPGFLGTYAPARSLEYLPDVARLEQSCHEALHSPASSSNEGQALAGIAGIAPEGYGDLLLRLHPSVHLLSSRYPVLRIWRANQRGSDGDCGEGAWRQERLLISRPGSGSVTIQALAPGDFALLDSLARRRSLAAANREAAAVQPEFDLMASLSLHIGSGIVVGFDMG